MGTLPSCIKRFSSIVGMEDEKKLFLCFCASLVVPVLDVRYPSLDTTCGSVSATRFSEKDNPRSVIEICKRFIKGEADREELASAYTNARRFRDSATGHASESATFCIYLLTKMLLIQADKSSDILKSNPDEIALDIIMLVVPAYMNLLQYSTRTHANASQALANLPSTAAYILNKYYPSESRCDEARKAEKCYKKQYHEIERWREDAEDKANTLIVELMDTEFSRLFPCY